MKLKIYFSFLLINFFIVSNPITVNAQCTCSGTVNTSGATVTFVSGCTFVSGSSWNGRPIIINGVTYIISSVTNSTHLTLTSSAGTQTNVSFSFNYTDVVTIDSTISQICQGSCVNVSSVTVTGMPPFGYQFSSTWSSNPCPLVNTTYSVTVTDQNACTASASVTVTVNPVPPTPVITCNSDTLVFTPDTSYISYQWYYNSFPISGATDSFYVVTNFGNYSVVVTNAYGCTATAQAPCLSIGINNYTDEYLISISPNPLTNSFVLTIHGSCNERNMRFVIFNVLGEEIRTVEIEKERTIISRKDMANGIYFYRIMQDGVVVHSGKLIVE